MIDTTTDRMRTRWPIEDCARCWGTGHYSFNQLDGTRCYGCNGTGQQTARGIANSDGRGQGGRDAGGRWGLRHDVQDDRPRGRGLALLRHHPEQHQRGRGRRAGALHRDAGAGARRRDDGIRQATN